MKTKMDVSSIERLDRIAHYIETRRSITVNELAEEFSIGLTTVRRDLDTLTRQGKILRVHGGAKALPKAPPEPPVLSRASEQSGEKQRIGRAAASLVQDGETIFLGAGTTVLEVARNLVHRQGLTVITNSLLVIDALEDAPNINLVGIGGYFRYKEKSFVGHIAERALADVRATRVFMGVRAIDIEQGLTEEFPAEAVTNRGILKIGQQAVILADHTKFGRVTGVFIAPVTAMHLLITDIETPSEYIQALEARSIPVIAV